MGVVSASYTVSVARTVPWKEIRNDMLNDLEVFFL